MSEKWNTVKPARCANWLVLPTVYSDALSYGEQLDKFCFQLNQLIENNNILPDFIAEMIKEYINSGAIGEVVRDILADYILNVKYPPEGITPAVGDGSADDTSAIQGCIDYAAENGGVVYFPYGSYLTQPLTMKDGVSLFGFDRYSTKIVLKGGATKPLIGGTVADLSIANLTLDGNSGIQVNDVNVVTIMGSNVLFTNLIIKDGYTLVNYAGTGGHFQISDVVFGNAVEKCLVTAGNADVQCENAVFNHLSAVGGISVMDIGTDGGFFNVKSVAPCNKCIVVSGNKNKISAIVENASIPVVDNGLQNNVEIFGVSMKSFYSKDITLNANSIDVTLQGERSVHAAGTSTFAVGANSTESVGGNKSEIVAGTTTQTYKNARIVNDTDVIYNGNKRVFNDNDFVVNSSNPLTYKKPEKINSRFNCVQFKDDEKTYNVLTEGLFFNKSFVIPQDFGAKGDGVTDDTEAFRSAIEYCIENGTALFVPAVTPLSNERGYILSKTLNIDYPITFVCDPLSTLYWKNAHTNNDKTVNVGRNNAKKYESGYGINIDYGTYAGHKGFYQFGIVQGDKSFIKQNATLPTGKYWVGINIQSADLVHLKAEYVNYWLVGTRLHSNDTGGVENCRIELGVIDDCDTGIVVYSSANGCYTNNIHFNTIGQGVYGISFNAISDIVNNVITGEQILVEAPSGVNIAVYDTTKPWNFKNNKISVKSCFNGVTPNTKNRHGYSGEPFWGTILTGNHNFGFGYGAYGSGDEYELGFWDYPSGKGNMAYYGGEGCALKNTLYNAINQNYTPVLSDAPINLSSFNNGGMIPSNVFMLEYVTENTVASDKILSLWFFATCLPIDCVSQISVEPMFLASKYCIENWNTTSTGLARILYKPESELSAGTHLKFLVKVGC